MREARLARPQVRASADDRGGGGAVVRRAKGRARDERLLVVHEAGDRVDSCHLECGGRVERRQDPRQPPREHRLPRAGWASQEEVVSACGPELERPPRSLLTMDVGEIGSLSRALAVRRERRLGVELELTAQIGRGLGEMADRDRGDAGESRLACGVGRAEKALGSEPPRALGDR